MTPTPLHALAQVGGILPPSTPPSPLDVLYVIGAVIVLVVLFGLVVMQLRKRLFAPDQADTTPASVFEELRRMRTRGVITDAEFEAMRLRAVEKIGRTSPSAPSPPPLSAAPAIRHRQARPGFDLTGERLPGADDGTGAA